MASTLRLRACATCGGHWSGWAEQEAPPGGGEPWHCPKHRAEKEARARAWTPERGQGCRLTLRRTGPFSDLCVVRVDGDRVEVQPIGFPDRRRWERRADLEPMP